MTWASQFSKVSHDTQLLSVKGCRTTIYRFIPRRSRKFRNDKASQEGQ